MSDRNVSSLVFIITGRYNMRFQFLKSHFKFGDNHLKNVEETCFKNIVVLLVIRSICKYQINAYRLIRIILTCWLIYLTCQITQRTEGRHCIVAHGHIKISLKNQIVASFVKLIHNAILTFKAVCHKILIRYRNSLKVFTNIYFSPRQFQQK